MEDLKKLSDLELRKKLKENGINSPLTSTTKSILIKKLNHTISKKKKSGLPNHTHSLRNNDSINYLENLSDSDLQKELTLYGIHSPVTVTSRSVLIHKLSDLILKETKNMPDRNHSKNTLFTYSDDEVDSDYNSRANTRINSRRKSPRSSVRHSKADTSSGDEFFNKSIYLLSKDTSHLENSFGNSSISNDINYDTGSDSDIDVHNTRRENSYTNTCTPEITKNHRDTSVSSRYKKNTGPITLHNGTNGSVLWNGISKSSLMENKKSENGKYFKYENLNQENNEASWLHSVPLILTILLIIFFILLGVCYVNITTPLLPFIKLLPSMFASHLERITTATHSKFANSINHFTDHTESKDIDVRKNENRFPICNDDGTSDSLCLSMAEMEEVQYYLGSLQTLIIPALQKCSADHQCGLNEHSYMSIDDLSELFSSIKEVKENNTMDGVKGLLKLCELNPHWGIAAKYVEDKCVGLEIENTSRQYLCHIWAFIHTIAYFIALLSAGIVIVWITISAIRHRKLQEEERKQKVYDIVEKVVEILENAFQKGTIKNNYIAVNHIRDEIFPPRDREAITELWDTVVSFIDQHESRIIREERNIGGEYCSVWRWITDIPSVSKREDSPVSANDSNVSEKIWQGQAFQSLEMTHNLPQTSPTPCLKIRNMFDSDIECGDQWTEVVQNSLLEKCKGINIVHIVVDRASKEGCVYVKCQNAEHAGLAYRALHGCWYDGNLVTVKYLREERYHERFPLAAFQTTPMSPSRSSKVTYQQSSSTLKRRNSSRHT